MNMKYSKDILAMQIKDVLTKGISADTQHNISLYQMWKSNSFTPINIARNIEC